MTKNLRIFLSIIPFILFLISSCFNKDKKEYNIEMLTKSEIQLLDKRLKPEDSIEIIYIYNKVTFPIQNNKNALSYLILYKLNNILNKDSSDYYFENFYNTQKKEPNIILTALYFQNRGYQLEKMGNNDSAGYYYYLSLNIKIKENLTYLLSNSYYNYSYYLFSQELYNEAIINSHKAIFYSEKKDSINPYYYNLIGNCYYQLEQDENARKYYNLGINRALANKDTLSYFAIKMNLVNLLIVSNQFDSALEYLNDAKVFNDKNKKKYQLSATLTNMGNIYSYKNKIDSSILFINESNQIAKENKYFDLLINNYEILSNLYLKKKEFSEAFKNLKYKQQYNDSLLENKNKNFVQELETKYKNEEQSSLIQFQNIKIEKSNLQIIISIIVAVFLLVMSTLLLLFYQRKIKDEKANHSKEINDMLKDSEEKIFSSLFKGRETERLKISEELHDGIGSQLALCKMQISTFSMENINDEKIASITKLVDKVSKEIRTLSHTMNSNSSYGFDINIALTELSEEINKTGLLMVNFSSTGDKISLDENRNVNIYRIVQEIINNTLKHAKAKAINIHLHKDDDKITLLLEDDGKGFNSNVKTDGIGMKNIKSRIKELDGELTIDSSIGLGTTFIIEIPTIKKRNKI